MIFIVVNGLDERLSVRLILVFVSVEMVMLVRISVSGFFDVLVSVNSSVSDIIVFRIVSSGSISGWILERLK